VDVTRRERWSKPSAQRAAAVVALVVVCSAVVLFPETTAAHRFSDEPAHVAWVRWAAERISSGHLPFDGWFPDLALGAPHFHQYQSLPHIAAGVFATFIDAQTVVSWTLYLLLVTWPISVYLGARLLDRSRRAAVIAAVLSPLLAAAPGFGLEWSSYLFRGTGLWTQAFGMWLIPISMGLTWRAVDRGRGLAPAALVLGLTLCCHLFWGYIAVIWLGIVVVAGAGRILRRLGNGALVALGGVLVAAWLLVPLIVDLRWVGQTGLRIPWEFDSYGASRVLDWLVHGSLLDNNREYLPTLTLLAMAGVVVCLVRIRRDASARALLIFTVLSTVLFFGRPTLGSVIDWLPFLDELPLHRFVGPVQLGALLLAGIGGAAIVNAVIRFAQRHLDVHPAYVIALLVVVGAALLYPAIKERATYEKDSHALLDAQRTRQRDDGADFADLVALATRRGGGRIFAGNVVSGGNFRVSQIPAYVEILNDGGLGLGFDGRVASISVDTELGFDPDRLDHYALYGVHYLIIPSVGTPNVPATLLRTRGLYSLYEVGPGGFLRVADSYGPAIAADRSDLGPRTSAFTASQLPALDGTQVIAFDGDAAAAPTADLAHRPAGSPGRVHAERDAPDDGAFSGAVHMNRRALVVLAESFHGRWTATVDGKPARTQMVAPSFVAVEVPAGDHEVAFRYAPYPSTSYAVLFALGAFAIVSLAVIDRRRRAGRR
jgi:Family of unknown function (DUF6541)